MSGKISERSPGQARSAAWPEDTTRPERRSDRVYESVLKDIMDGTLPLGSRLPTETILSGQFEVSRPLVREALARLRDDGLIYSRQGSGSYVRARPDRAALRFVPIDSLAAIHRVYEFRQSVEGDAAYWAAERSSRKSLGEIRRALAEMDAAIRSDEVGATADFDLHCAIARASANPFYVSVLASLRNQIIFGMSLGRNLALTREGEHREMARRQHHLIVDAITAGRGEEARVSMRRHLEMSRRTLFEGSDASA